eukprot:3557345-Pleurochrysis_carterae.AAC.1
MPVHSLSLFQTTFSRVFGLNPSSTAPRFAALFLSSSDTCRPRLAASHAQRTTRPHNAPAASLSFAVCAGWSRLAAAANGRKRARQGTHRQEGTVAKASTVAKIAKRLAAAQVARRQVGR